MPGIEKGLNISRGRETLYVTVKDHLGFCAHCTHQVVTQTVDFSFPLYVDLTVGCRRIPHSQRHVFSFENKSSCVAVGKRDLCSPAAF